MKKFTRADGTSTRADARRSRARIEALASPIALALALALPATALAVPPSDPQPFATASAEFGQLTPSDDVDPQSGSVDPDSDPYVPYDPPLAEGERSELAGDEIQATLGSLFVGTFETGNYSPWTLVQEEQADRIRIVRSPVRQGSLASRHEVQHGDYVGGGARAEVSWGRGDSPTLRSGYDRWFGWSTYFPGNFPTPPYGNGQHTVFLQWKQSGTGEPPLRMSAEGNRISLRRPGGDLWSTPLRRGVWNDFVAHIRFSSNSDVGRVELWHNGNKVLAGRNVRTLADGQSSYVKLGYYRHKDITTTAAIYQDAFKVGTSYADVNPR